MSKLLWHNGTPVTTGIYWFDNGLRLPHGINDYPTILQVYGASYIFGNGGSMPLSCIYNPKLCKKAKWAHIEQPSKWEDLSCIRDNHTYAWVLHNNIMGFGIFNPGYHNNVGGSVAWLTGQNAFESGFWWPAKDNYKFSIVSCPKLK